MIKAAKRAVYAILGDADVTDEELMTAFTGAKALMNSRLLTDSNMAANIERIKSWGHRACYFT